LAKKISRIDRRFAAFARLKNKKSAGDSTTRQRQQQLQRQKHDNNKDTATAFVPKSFFKTAKFLPILSSLNNNFRPEIIF
jgi:hypothetical protein